MAGGIEALPTPIIVGNRCTWCDAGGYSFDQCPKCKREKCRAPAWPASMELRVKCGTIDRVVTFNRGASGDCCAQYNATIPQTALASFSQSRITKSIRRTILTSGTMYRICVNGAPSPCKWPKVAAWSFESQVYAWWQCAWQYYLDAISLRLSIQRKPIDGSCGWLATLVVQGAHQQACSARWLGYVTGTGFSTATYCEAWQFTSLLGCVTVPSNSSCPTIPVEPTTNYATSFTSYPFRHVYSAALSTPKFEVPITFSTNTAGVPKCETGTLTEFDTTVPTCACSDPVPTPNTYCAVQCIGSAACAPCLAGYSDCSGTPPAACSCSYAEQLERTQTTTDDDFSVSGASGPTLPSLTSWNLELP